MVGLPGGEGEDTTDPIVRADACLTSQGTVELVKGTSINL
jgi:hypothetical protein